MELIRDYWGVIVGTVGLAVWLARLEARGFTNAAEIKRRAVDHAIEIKRLWSQRKEDLDLARESRDRTDRTLEEIGRDIKTLLAHRPPP
jgi:hypothetical protein